MTKKSVDVKVARKLNSEMTDPARLELEQHIRYPGDYSYLYAKKITVVCDQPTDVFFENKM